MPLLRQIDTNLDLISRSLQLPQQKRLPQQGVNSLFDPSSFSLNEAYSSTNRTIALQGGSDVTPIIGGHAKGMARTGSTDGKQDTRIVNEAFQDAVILLEEGFESKMQAEMLVLVDVLHKPAAIFPATSSFRVKRQDKHFIGK